MSTLPWTNTNDISAETNFCNVYTCAHDNIGFIIVECRFWQTFAQLSDVLHKDYLTNAEVPDTDKYYSFTVADSWFPREETSTVVEPMFGQIFLETACEWRKLGREDGSTFEICVCRYVTSLFWEIIQNMPRTKSWWNDGRSRTLAVFIPFIWLALISGVTKIHIST